MRKTEPENAAEPTEDYKCYVVRDDCVDEREEHTQPSINNLNIDNVFFPKKPHVKLSFQDYCYIANDFYTHHIGKRRGNNR